MFLCNLFAGITIALSNEEHSVVKKVAGTDLFCAENLNQVELRIAEELYYRKILNKTINCNIVYFFIPNQELDREPLCDRQF